MKNRLLSLLLVCVMLCTMLPVSALAEGQGDAAPVPEQADTGTPESAGGPEAAATPEIPAEPEPTEQAPAEPTLIAEPAVEPATVAAPAPAANEQAAMPVAAAPAFPDAVSATYKEKQVAFVPSDKVNVVTLKMNGLSYAQVKTLFEDKGTEFALTGPDGDVALGTDCGMASILSMVWFSLPQKISKAGVYTLTMTNGGKSVSSSFTVIEINFRAGDGRFSDGSQTYTGYGTADAYFSNFNVTAPTRDSDTAEFHGFLGWAATESVSTYGSLITKVSDATAGAGENAYNVYAAYGEQSVSGYQIQETSGTGQKGVNSYDFGMVKLGAANSKTFYIRNTGTRTFDSLAMNVTNSDGFTIKLERGNETVGSKVEKFAKGEELKLTISTEKLSMGHHEIQLQFDANRYMQSLTIKADVTPGAVIITPAEKTKEYGQVLTGSDVPFKVTNQVGVSQSLRPEDLGVTLTSGGFTADAAPGDYDYEVVNSGGQDFTVQLAEGSPKLKVVAAKPREVSVSATSIQPGAKLSTSVLSGTFMNPYQEWNVAGTLTWQNGEQSWSEKGPQTCSWTFTPDDQIKYTTVDGTVLVQVNEKEPTVITLAGVSTSFEYDGKPHGLEFNTNRPEPAVVEVKYRPADSADDSAWTEELPIKPGTYSVQASVAETPDHAGQTDQYSMTIEKRTVSIYNYSAIGKEYDGTVDAANASPSVILSNIVQGEEVRAEITAVFDRKDVGSRNVAITITELTGADAANYKLPERTTCHTTAIIRPRKLTFTPVSLTKVYGETKSLTAADFTIEGLLENDEVSFEFVCDGKGPDATVGSYEITAYLPGGGNYTLGSSGTSQTANAGKLEVGRATPVMSNIKPGEGYRDNTVGQVALTGEFVNPYTNQPVEGTLEWADPEARLAVPAKATWIFTPKDPNYVPDPITGEVVITLLDKEPIHLNVNNATVTYDGERHGIETPVLADGETADPEDLEFRVEYKEHKDIVTAAFLDAGFDDYSTDEPTEAGTYDVHVHVFVGGKTAETRADTLVEATLEILPRTPDVPAMQTVTVPQGTLLSGDLDGKMKQRPTGVHGEELAGTFSWDAPGAKIEDDGYYQWTFTPDSKNYTQVTGWTTVQLEEDGREIAAEVYNLPDAMNYQDYAVVDVKASGLKAGDVVTFFEKEACVNPESDPTVVTEADVTSGKLTVMLDADALDDMDGVIYARITSSSKNPATQLSYGPEPQVSLLVDGVETNEILLEIGKSRTVSAEVYGDYVVQSVAYSLNSASGIVKLKDNGDKTAALSANVGSKAVLTAEVVLKHPDPAKANETIVYTFSINVFCWGVNVSVTSDLSGSVASDVQLAESVLSADEIGQAVENGQEVNIALSVMAKTEAEVPTDDVNQVKAACTPDGYTLGQYMEIDLTKTVTTNGLEGSDVPIHKTNAPITIRVNVPETLLTALSQSKEGLSWTEFAVVRVHDGVTTVLPDLDSDPRTVTFESDLFSTYAMVYRGITARGELTVSNQVTGNMGDKEKEFEYTLQVTYEKEDQVLNGKYGELTFTEGKAEFKLKHGASIKAEDLPAGGKYTVTQAADAAYYTTSAGASGTIADGGEHKAEFTNKRDIHTVTFDPNGGKLSGSAKATTGPDGRLSSLPKATKEGEYFAGWYTAPNGGTKVTVEREYTADATLYAHWSKTPVTGDQNNAALWAALLGVSAVAICAGAVILVRRKKKAK